jgi:hypothetical protein
MQIIFIAIASMPCSSLFSVRSHRLVRCGKFVHQIFRLDPAMRTEGDRREKWSADRRGLRPGAFRLFSGTRGARSFVATLLSCSAGCMLLNPDVDLVGFESAQLFVPRQWRLSFAFLSAYFFTLFALLRGYVRRDLRPKSYGDISVRLIAVAILA